MAAAYLTLSLLLYWRANRSIHCFNQNLIGNIWGGFMPKSTFLIRGRNWNWPSWRTQSGLCRLSISQFTSLTLDTFLLVLHVDWTYISRILDFYYTHLIVNKWTLWMVRCAIVNIPYFSCYVLWCSRTAGENRLPFLWHYTNCSTLSVKVTKHLVAVNQLFDEISVFMLTEHFTTVKTTGESSNDSCFLLNLIRLT